MKTEEPQSLEEMRRDWRARQQLAAADLECRRKKFLIEALVGVTVLVVVELCIMAVFGGPDLLTVFCVVSIGYLFGLFCIRHHWSGGVGILIHGMGLGITFMLLGGFHVFWFGIWAIWGWLIANAISGARDSHLNPY